MGAVVGDCRSRDEDIRADEVASHGLEHLLGALHFDSVHAARSRNLHGSAHQHDFSTGFTWAKDLTDTQDSGGGGTTFAGQVIQNPNNRAIEKANKGQGGYIKFEESWYDLNDDATPDGSEIKATAEKLGADLG